MPKFNGSNDPEEYLSWALKVDKIFHLHKYEEEKKITMASLEFQDYVLIWWEQVIERREARGEPPITTWAQMKDVMTTCFVPTYYNRDLFKKLQLLKQGTKSVEEYYKEMEIAMIRANVTEDDEKTMARFLNGLHHHHPQPMRPSRRVPSSVSLAAAEATSPSNARTSEQ